jgi:uncharacterized protein
MCGSTKTEAHKKETPLTGRTHTTSLIPRSLLVFMRPFSWVSLFSLVALMALFLPGSLCAESPLPKPSGPVNDFADRMTPPYEKRIGNISKELVDKTGVALFVVTVPDLGSADASEYAERLYSAWNIGKNGADKGVLILVSVRERKLQVRMGTGVKALVSPHQIVEIQDRFVAPLLKQNNYDDGLLNGVVAIAKIISKEAGVTFTGDAVPKAAPKSRSGSTLALALLVVGAAILAFVLWRNARRKKPPKDDAAKIP